MKNKDWKYYGLSVTLICNIISLKYKMVPLSNYLVIITQLISAKSQMDTSSLGFSYNILMNFMQSNFVQCHL